MFGLPPGRPTARRHRRTATLLLSASALLLPVTACSKSDDAAPTATLPTTTSSSTSAPPPTTTTTTVQDVEAEVKAAYLRADAVFYEILKAPDPMDKRLPATRSGKSLREVTSTMAERKAQRIVARFSDIGPPRTTVDSVQVSGDKATLHACVVDDSDQVRSGSGEVLDDEHFSYKVTVTLERSGTTWKVASGTQTNTWPDLKGCER